MTPQDMAALHLACFTTPRPWSSAEIKDILDNPYCFVCTVPEGFAIGRAVAGEAELLTIAVAPAAQGRGIGAALIDDFLAKAKLRQSESAFLEVAENNGAAISLYVKKGFVQTGQRPRYYHQPDGSAVSALTFAYVF
jgi:[ribosomal protein S18]-alanine N-acetyltransferase